jgi:8-amino-7-oxononanoate synthase
MSGPPLREQLAREEEEARKRGLQRRIEEPGGRDFTSNDYLGLARDPRVASAAAEGALRFGAGASASRLLGGSLPPHAAAEEEAKSWLLAEDALLLPSGWHANLALLTTLADRRDALLCDRANHASLVDGARLSRAEILLFDRNDPADLERCLRAAARRRRRFVVCESVHSMEGDRTPLGEYDRLAREHDAWLLVDEAHAAGLLGADGRGLAAGLRRLAAATVTGGKALGIAGAFLAGPREVISAVRGRGRPFLFTTAIPPGSAAALAAAIRIARNEPWRRERALSNAARLRAALGSRAVPAGGDSPIVPVLFGPPEAALAAAEEVRGAGFDVRAVRPPTVPEGTSRIRLICRAGHEAEEIDRLAEAVAAAVRRRAAPSRPRPARRAAPVAVAGTDTGVGKTVVSALLLRAARRAGLVPRYLKIVQTGPDSDTAAVASLAGLGGEVATTPLLSLPLPASIDQAAEAAGVEVEAEKLALSVRARLAEAPDAAWVLECAGGLLVPLNGREDQADLLAILRPRIVLVARSGLGTLNHTRLTLEALFRRGLSVRAILLVGERHDANERTLRRFLPETELFRIPPFGPPGAAAFDAWLEESGFRWPA